jgi:hypothetical protein
VTLARHIARVTPSAIVTERSQLKVFVASRAKSRELGEGIPHRIDVHPSPRLEFDAIQGHNYGGAFNRDDERLDGEVLSPHRSDDFTLALTEAAHLDESNLRRIED